ncbi:hypothetical protein BD779DRAFT_1473508 [Infundibulicybe gibba]|nr:hypothetical protein BD779DRAFT_1473508 [Infundibulicybe gibba]
MSPSEEHQKEIRKYKQLLQNARDSARGARGYDSAQTRSILHSEFSRRNPGLSAYGWQVDVAEALLLGLDCSVIAGTGAGKTSPFVMPLFIEVEKVIVIISPLNALEEDQVHQQNGKPVEGLEGLVHLGCLEILHSTPVTHPDAHIPRGFQTSQLVT